MDRIRRPGSPMTPVPHALPLSVQPQQGSEVASQLPRSDTGQTIDMPLLVPRYPDNKTSVAVELPPEGKHRICFIGSGAFGNVMNRIVAHNAAKYPELFELKVRQWVFEMSLPNGQPNPDWKPWEKMRENTVPCATLEETLKDATLIVICLPHQFIASTCKKMKPFLRTNYTPHLLSMTKGVLISEGGIELVSTTISRELGIPTCSVLMGANVASEIAAGQPTEATVGCNEPGMGELWKKVFYTSKFLVQDVGDVVGVELCGALKNIVAVACGFVDGLGYGNNTKATMMRLGLVEMQHFCKVFYPSTRTRTFFESCGIADLIATCYGGRNRQVAEAMVKTGKSYAELEKEMLGGQKLQGPLTAEEVNHMLKGKSLEARFPLFTTTHLICIGEKTPQHIIDDVFPNTESAHLLVKDEIREWYDYAISIDANLGQYIKRRSSLNPEIAAPMTNDISS